MHLGGCYRHAQEEHRIVITVFYDGTCGLCHRSVQFLLKRDPGGKLFRYATLDGTTADETLPPKHCRPDSVAVLTNEKDLLTRADAAIYVGRALGGVWALLSWLFALLPRFVRDGLYNGIAKRRYALFGTRSESCPILPAEQRAFFLP